MAILAGMAVALLAGREPMMHRQKNTMKATLLILVLSSLLGGCVRRVLVRRARELHAR
jgi:hypothetical protein